VFAHDEIERAVGEMRAQFLTVSGQIADELTRLADYITAAPAGVREHVIAAAAQIASMQARLRLEADRLPAGAQERYAIMQSVLQAQQGALQQLAIIVKQHAPASFPELTIAHVSPGPDQAFTHVGANVHASAVDMHSPGAQPAWPPMLAAEGSMSVPYMNGVPPDGPVEMPWLGYDNHARAPTAARRGSRERRAARVSGSTARPMFVQARRRAETVMNSAGSRGLVVIGIVISSLVFAYLAFPLGGNPQDAAAKRLKTAMRPADERAVPASRAAEPPPRAPAMESPPLPPATILHVPGATLQPPGPPAAPSPEIIVPGLAIGVPQVPFVTEGPDPAAAAAEPTKPDPPAVPTPAAETAVRPPGDPSPGAAAQPKQRLAPARAETETPAPAVAAREERFVAVVFTHKDQSTATRAFADLQQQYPGLLTKRQGEVQAIDVGKKGVWHRLAVLPAGSRQEAANLCEQLMAAGYDRCWVKPY
jgi:sporulation related protein